MVRQDDSSVHFLNSSPLARVSLDDTRLMSSSLVYPSSPSSSGYHLAADKTSNLHWGSSAYMQPSIGNYPTPSTTTTGLRPRSAADGGLDHHLHSYFDSYHDRPSPFHNSTAGPSNDAYTYGVVPDSLLLGRSDTSSYIPTPQLGDYLHDPSNVSGVSESGDMGMASSQQPFYSSDVYDLGRYAPGMGREANAIQPSLSFTLPGIPNAEEAFLTHIDQSTSGISMEEPLPGDPRRDLLMLPSGYQPPLGFGNDDDRDIERNLYNTHIGTGSPSSESSRSSQKRAREELDALASSGAESSAWGVASPVIKRQRLDDVASSVNYQGRRTKARGYESDEEADEDDFFDSGNEDSDAYIPSRSPSPVLPTVILTTPSPPGSTVEYISPDVKTRGRKKAGGKAKGSAARALAMVTEAREQQDRQERAELGYTGWDAEGASYYDLGGGISEGEGSNSGTLAQTLVPTPNLTKKSRGRKVPYVAAVRGGEGIGEGFPVPGIVAMSTGGRRGRRKAAAGGRSAGTMVDSQMPAGEERSFVCVVPGCGKCFVRGEHLKRHVRSIHTDDKPFVCPHKGCGKSFSRRDNLGQHVRIHLHD